MDNSGNVVWYSPVPTTGAGYNDVRQLDNGDLFLQLASPYNEFIEMNMLGANGQDLAPPADIRLILHEGLVTSHGTIMYLSDVSQVVSNFPTSDTVSNPPLAYMTNVDDNPLSKSLYQFRAPERLVAAD